MARVGKIFEDSGTEGLGKTTIDHPDIDTDPGSTPPDHTHIDHDLSHKACLKEIASLFEDIQADLRVITDRADNDTKGVYTRNADTVANNPANVAAQAAKVDALKRAGQFQILNAELANPTDFSNLKPANFSSINSTGASQGGFAGGTSGNKKPVGFGGADTLTNPDGKLVALVDAELSVISLANAGGAGAVKYGNAGSKRKLPIQQELFSILETAAASAGVSALIISGGQVPADQGGVEGVNRTGSNRHDKGYGADVVLYAPDFKGRELVGNNQIDLGIILQFIQACKDAGATAVGQGNGYMNDTAIHVDIAWKAQVAGQISGIKSNRYWGGGQSNGSKTKTANAPKYLSDLMDPRDNTA